MALLGGVTDQVGPGVHTVEGIFFRRVKPYCGVKCSQGLHFLATTFIGKKDSSSTAQELMKECDLVRYNTMI